jgi:y4mF family transcriptional regulator
MSFSTFDLLWGANFSFSMRTNGSQPWPSRLGSSVRARRRLLRLTQGQLATLAGCGTAFLYQLENGKASLRLDKLVDVLHVLGLQLTIEPGKEKVVAR